MNANKHEFGKIQEKANHQVHGRTKRPLITSLTRTFNFFAHKQFPIQIRATQRTQLPKSLSAISALLTIKFVPRREGFHQAAFRSVASVEISGKQVFDPRSSAVKKRALLWLRYPVTSVANLYFPLPVN
jgi:hypothetical protein